MGKIRIFGMKTDDRVDAYIAQADPFAKPILLHLRALVHKACPEVEETIKWHNPFFMYKGKLVCFMAEFKEHCSFGFWAREMRKISIENDPTVKAGRGAFGRISKLQELPRDKAIIGYIQQAVALSDTGTPTSRRTAKSK